MNKLFRIQVLICFFVGVTMSCTEETHSPVADTSHQEMSLDISVEEARKVFQKYQADVAARTVENHKKKNWKKDPLWKLAKKERLENGTSVVVVQLDDSQEKPILRIAESRGQTQPQLNTIRKLLVYKNKKGKEIMEVMYVIPENSYHDSHRGFYADADFDGKLWIENMDGEFKKGFELKAGKIISKMMNKPTNNEEARTSCVEVTYPVTTVVDWTSRACVNGNCYDQPMYTETKTVWVTVMACSGLITYNPVVALFSKYTDDDATNSAIQLNYKINAPKNPINSLALTLECFGKYQQFSNGDRFKYSFTIYNDEPVNGSVKLIDFNAVERRAGHTYFELERHDVQTGEFVRKVVGFYPKSGWQSMSGWNVEGQWGDDGDSNYDESIYVSVRPDQFYAIIDVLGGPEGTPTYNIQGGEGNWSGKNCVSMVQFIAKDYLINMPVGLAMTPFGWTYTPADFGQEIRSNYQAIESQQGVDVTIGGNRSPKSTKCALNR